MTRTNVLNKNTAKLNMLETVDVSLNEIFQIEHGVDLVDGD